MEKETINLGVYYNQVKDEVLKASTAPRILYSTGLKTLDPFYKIRPKGTTYIHGAPFSGKSEITFEIITNLARVHNHRSIIYSPETGTPEEIYEKIIECVIDNGIENFTKISDDDMRLVNDFVHEMFYVIDNGDNDLDIFGLYEQVEMAIKSNPKKKYDYLVIDPFNELVTSYGKEPRDEVLSKMLGRIRKKSRVLDFHTFVVFHSAKQEEVEVNIDGQKVRFVPPASPHRIAGGETPFRKGEMVLCIWRPPVTLKDDYGIFYEDNDTIVFIQKYKPYWTGRIGKVRLKYVSKTKNYLYEEYGQWKPAE